MGQTLDSGDLEDERRMWASLLMVHDVDVKVTVQP